MRSGFVTVAGRPNVGKSTLVNALCGAKIAIVSDKPQTTRRRIRGIYTIEDAQLVLTDIPGFQKPLDPMTERMQQTVEHAFEDVDAVLFVLDARERIGGGDRFIASRVFSIGVPVVIATKAWTGSGTPLRGGLPSGHAALGFAGWMAATYIVNDSHRFLISALTFIMALLVAQARVEAGVHSALEVAYGGALVTLALFQVFS